MGSESSLNNSSLGESFNRPPSAVQSPKYANRLDSHKEAHEIRPADGTNTDTHKEDDFTPVAARKVLVVDDVLSNRKMLLRLLLQREIKDCVQAEDGQKAVDAFLATRKELSESTGIALEHCEPFDTILMDFEMPVMNGPTAAHLLREYGCKALIVGISGNVLPADVEFYKNMGADAVLSKPLKFAELEEIWRNQGKQY